MGHSVIGVEFVEECVRSYFIESGLQMEEATLAARSVGESAIRKHFGDVSGRIALVDYFVRERIVAFAEAGGPFTVCLWHMTPQLK
ncbi:hypothetical protein MTO96_016260 [Rhipicephalus appendiculatus]